MSNPLRRPAKSEPAKTPLLTHALATAIVIAAASFRGFWIVPIAPAAESSLDLPVGAYETEGYFLPALGGCRQGEKVPLGGQTVELCFGNAQSPPFRKSSPNWIFYVLRNEGRLGEYQWQAWHGEFEFENGAIKLCGRDGMTGLVPQGPAKPSKHTIKIFGDMVGSGRMVKFEMVWDHGLAKGEPPPLQEQQPIRCKPAVASGRTGTPVAGIPRGALAASFAPTPVPRRGVNGVLMLGLGPGAADRDSRLWNCLVNQGNYPGVHFVEETSHADEWSYIWPDGRFRAVLDGGRHYEWRLAAPIRCGIIRAQAYRAEFGVPALPVSSEEKLVLACLVADEGFSGCRSWWLRRPQ